MSEFYDSIGLTELSDELEAIAIAFGVKTNTKLDKNFFRQDIKMFKQVTKNWNKKTDEEKKAIKDKIEKERKGKKSTKGKTVQKGTEPTKNAPTKSTRPTARPSRLQGPAGYVGYQAGQVDPGLAAAIGITPSSSTSSKSASDAGYGTDPKGEFGDTPTAPSGSSSSAPSAPDGGAADAEAEADSGGGFGSADWGGGDAATGALNKGGFIKPRNKAKAKSYKKGLGLR